MHYQFWYWDYVFLFSFLAGCFGILVLILGNKCIVLFILILFRDWTGLVYLWLCCGLGIYVAGVAAGGCWPRSLLLGQLIERCWLFALPSHSGLV